MQSEKISERFYQQNALTLAPKLLGKILTRRFGKSTVSGMITEVEAYIGKDDQASHAYNGMKNRNKIMFEKGGYFYVYFTYGNHHCCNIVTGKFGDGQAVLIRSVEPIDGAESMSMNRYGYMYQTEKDRRNLTNGPGKLCKAFGITLEQNGVSLQGNEVWLSHGKHIRETSIGQSPRIGISKSVELPWRFYILNNPFVSKFR